LIYKKKKTIFACKNRFFFVTLYLINQRKDGARPVSTKNTKNYELFF